MPRKGMRSICFNPRTPSFSSHQSSHSTPSRRSSSEFMIDQTIETASAIIMKWNPNSSTYASVTSLFYENKSEARLFIKCVNELQKVMQLIVSDDSTSPKLVESQILMQIAMKRLQKEFYQILSTNRAYLDPESVSVRSSRTSARSSISDYEDDGSRDDDVHVASDSITELEDVSSFAMADLRSIAECMISSGYAKECVSIYKIIRKSIIDEGIYRLGVERVSSSQMNKMDWEVLDLKIKNWLEAMKVSMKTLFNGERILCDSVFSMSDSVRESCFTDISKEGANLLFVFPELVATKNKKSSPDKLFRLLDMFTSIAQHWQDIETIFSFESASTIRSQALNSLIKLSDSVRSMISKFEQSIYKESSKSPPPGGGLHSLTTNTMDHLCLLADYSNVLMDILADWTPQPRKSSSLPEYSFSGSYSVSDDSPTSAISACIAWLVTVLLCKLDGKAKHYKDVSISYLFIANNLQHVVSKVRTSNLHYLLGEEWTAKHEAKVRQYAANYEKLAWGRVFSSLPENPTAVISRKQANEWFRRFNNSFEEAYKRQSSCIVPDTKLRDEIKVSIAAKLVKVYREFYDMHRLWITGAGDEENVRSIVRFDPEDVGHYLSDLFFGTVSTASTSSSSSASAPASSLQRHSRDFQLSFRV